MKLTYSDINKQKKIIEKGGGQARIDKQHELEKYTARERIELLLDKGSFVEIDAFVSHRCVDFGMQNTSAPADGVIVGFGTIDGRPVYLYSQDFTVIGGSLGEVHAQKICKVLDMAKKTGTPIIGINDSGGARIQEGLDSLSGFGEIFKRISNLSGVVPQISIIVGPCAGGAVYAPAMTDFIFMVEKTSHMFITGPAVVSAVTKEEVNADMLGGSSIHSEKSGVAGFVSKNEEECFSNVRRLLAYLPSNNLENPPTIKTLDDINKQIPILAEIIPNNPNAPYDMKKILVEVVDGGELFEVFSKFAPNIITAFAHLGGKTVGIIANQPNFMAGILDINSSDKAARFVRFCDAFGIPLITFTDIPGYMPGVKEEHGGIIRHGAKLLYAFSEATVPKINLIIRKAYGGAYIAMNSKHLGADLVFAWPSAEIAVMGPEGAANIIFRNEIKNSNDPAATRQEKINEYKEKFANPLVAAKRGYIDDIINPINTRPILINALLMIENKQENGPRRKHGNIPL